MSGPQCCSNPPTLNPNSGAGHVEKLAGLDTYVSGSPETKLTILLISDVFGYEAPILRSLADKVAAAGYYVVVPDFLYGDPLVLDNPDKPLPVWLKEHGPDKGFEDAKRVIEELRSKGYSAIGAAGFCWGAKVVVELSKFALIEAAVLLHPSFVTVEDINDGKVPISILGAEIDHLSPPALVKKFEETLNAKPEVDAYVKIFPKVSHGWTVRYNLEDAEAVKSADEAHQNMLEWFAKLDPRDSAMYTLEVFGTIWIREKGGSRSAQYDTVLADTFKDGYLMVADEYASDCHRSPVLSFNQREDNIIEICEECNLRKYCLEDETCNVVQIALFESEGLVLNLIRQGDAGRQIRNTCMRWRGTPVQSGAPNTT
ncbi:hypothetical protein ACFE04_011505 [Oxalis oulophora]